jgi:xylulose-5-phosphate/fructose-6-phosphate phosphoketolase
VRGYKEEGTTTTPFDMAVRNDIDRYHLLLDVAQRVPAAARYATKLRAFAREMRAQHERYIVQRGEDMPEVRDWHWQGQAGAAGGQGGE